MEFASLKHDFVFREVFSREEIRKQFISDVTGIPIESILWARLDTPFLWRRQRRQKQGILDIAARLHDGTRIDIELQVRNRKDWRKRNLFYLAKMYTGDFWAGENYERLRKCITISILDFSLTEDEAYHSVYRLRDREGKEFSDLFEVHIIELKKMLTGGGAVDDWIRLFNAGSLEELNGMKTNNAGIEMAKELMREMSLSRNLRWLYESHMKAVRDRRAEDAFVREEGREEGRKEGEAKKLVSQVCRKLSKGKSAEVIAEELEEDISEVQRIYDVAVKYAPDYDVQKIVKKLMKPR